MNTRMPFGIPRDLGILAVSNLIWGLGEGLFIFFTHCRSSVGRSTRYRLARCSVSSGSSWLWCRRRPAIFRTGWNAPFDPRWLYPGGDRGRHDGGGEKLTVFYCRFDRLQRHLFYCRAAQQLYHPYAR